MANATKADADDRKLSPEQTWAINPEITVIVNPEYAHSFILPLMKGSNKTITPIILVKASSTLK